MYHPQTMETLAREHHADLLREAREVRLGRLASGTEMYPGQARIHQRLVVVAAALAIVLGIVVI